MRIGEAARCAAALTQASASASAMAALRGGPDVVSVPLVDLLAGFDAHLQAVLRRRQRARRVRVERARRVLRAVEVERDLPVRVGTAGIEEACRGVRVLPA